MRHTHINTGIYTDKNANTHKHIHKRGLVHIPTYRDVHKKIQKDMHTIFMNTNLRVKHTILTSNQLYISHTLIFSINSGYE